MIKKSLRLFTFFLHRKLGNQLEQLFIVMAHPTLVLTLELTENLTIFLILVLDIVQ